MTNINDIIMKYYPHLVRLSKGKPDQKTGLSESDIQRFGQSLRILQRGLTGTRPLAGASYFSETEFLNAYLLYYWPVSFIQAFLALTELRLRGELPDIANVLDLGAGPGPAACAAAELGAKNFVLMDANARALDAALRLAALTGNPPGAFSAVERNFETDDSIPEGTFDLIVASHSTNELWKERGDAIGLRASLLRKACGRLSENGIILVIEPAALVTGRPALQLRNQLLADAADSRLYSCVGPCPGSSPCPMVKEGESRTCHSTWQWVPPDTIATLAKEAGLDRDSVKATWFALKKTAKPGGPTRSPSGIDRLSDERPRIDAGVLDDSVSDGSVSGRVVSEPMLNKAGRIRYIVCTRDGLTTVSAHREDEKAKSCGFFSLMRGDCIRGSALQKRLGKNNYGLQEGSSLEITLRAPMPDRTQKGSL